MQYAGWWAGLTAPFAAMGYFLGRPKLWKYALWPLLLNCVLVGVLLTVGFWLIWRPALDWLREHNDVLFGALAFLAPLLLALLLLLLGAIAFVLLAGLLGAPFYDVMCQQIEAEIFAMRPELLSPPMTLRESVVHSL